MALNIGRNLYSAGRPSHGALAHILVNSVTVSLQFNQQTADIIDGRVGHATCFIHALALHPFTKVGPHSSFYSARNACIASAVLATAIPSVRPSVRLSVCPSHAGIVSKRQHVARCSKNGVILQNSVWPCVKDHEALCACAKSRRDLSRRPRFPVNRFKFRQSDSI